MTDQGLQKLEEIFRVVLDLPPGSDPSSAHRITSSRWDSLAHVSLVAAIESEFGIVLSLQDIERLTSFEAARMLLTEKGQ